MNLLQSSFYFLLFANSTLAMDLTDVPQKTSSPADKFIQKFFFRMTFNDAATEFNTLEKETQKDIFKTVDNNQDKTLSIALRLALLPKELQYKILSRNYDKKSIPNNITHIMNGRSINNHVTLCANIGKWQKKSFAGFIINTIKPSNYNYGDHYCSKRGKNVNSKDTNIVINFTAPELFQYGSDTIKILQRIATCPKNGTTYSWDANCLSRKELSLLNNLSDDLLNQLTNNLHCCAQAYNDYRIWFTYHDKLTPLSLAKAAFNSCKQWLPIIIPPLLYSHLFYTQPIENLWQNIQDPSLLTENQKKEFTNNLIDKLQAKGTPDSERLLKHIIDPVPFKWVFTQEYTILDPYISPLIITCLCKISQPIFIHGITVGLIGITAVASLCGIIKKIYSSYLLKRKSIDFTKEKFQNKSAKDVISYYTNKPHYNIREKIVSWEEHDQLH